MIHWKKIIGISLFSIFSLAVSAQFLNVTAISTDVSCFNGSDGTGKVTSVTGGVPPYTYQWLYNDLTPIVDSTNSKISGLPAGNYFVQVYDVDSSSTGVDNITILNGPNIAILIFKMNVTCNGADDGEIQILAAGGNPPLEYSINGGSGYQAGSSFTGLPPGNYNVAVRDSKGCTKIYASNPVVISQPGPLTVVLDSSRNIDCYGADNGGIWVSITGGTTPYDFLWSGPGFSATTEDITGLGPGDYSLSVTDANGCTTGLGPVTLTEPPQIVINNVTATDETCHDAGNGTITVTAGGGTGTLYYTLIPGPTNTTGIFGSLSGNTYSISITDDNGCGPVIQNNIVVGNPDPITIASEDTTSITCNGANDGSISVRGAGGTPPYDYTLMPGALDNNATGDFFNIVPGNGYYVSVTDANNCPPASSITWDFVEPAPITLTPLDTNDVTCSGDADGSLSVLAGGGTPPYLYTLTPGPVSQTLGDFSGLTGGTYSVSVTDSRSCAPAVVGNLVINDPAPIAIDNVVTSDVTCFGDNDGFVVVTASGGTGTLHYTLNPGPILNTDGNFTGLGPDIYDVSVTDDNSCPAATAFNLVVNEPSVISIDTEDTTSISCNGANDGTITIVASGGTPPLVFSLSPGSYPVNNNGIFAGLVPAPGYQVLVTDANNCPAITSSSWDFVEPAPITLTPLDTNDVTCSGDADGSLSVLAGGGTPPYLYTLTPGLVSQALGDFSGLTGGTYSVSVTDSRNCTPAVVSDMVVNDPVPISIDNINSTDLSCNGSGDGSILVTASGGTGTLYYTLTPGPINNTNGNFTGLSGENYSLSITDDNGCGPATAANLLVGEPAPITIDNEDTTGISCNGAADARIQITASGGTGLLTYILKDPAPVDTNTTGLFTGLAPGTYTVDVNDVNGCGPLTSNPFTFTEPAPLSATVLPSSVRILNCYGDPSGILNITVTGGHIPYTYAWTGPNGFTATSKNISGLKAGDYNLTITDANGCMINYSPLDSITEPPLLTMSLSRTDITCFGDANGSVTITAGGGTPAYQYSRNGLIWQASNVFSPLNPGIYTFYTRDSKGCTVTQKDTLVQPAEIKITKEETDNLGQLCFGDSNGIIIITATGGTGLLQYSIDSGKTYVPNNTFMGLGGGEYFIFVRDAKGCTRKGGKPLIQEPPELYISTYAQQDITSCADAPEGQVVIEGTGGSLPLRYVLDVADTNLTGIFTNLPRGPHDLQILDTKGCTRDTSVVINSPPPIFVSTMIQHVTSCYGDSAGMITIIGSGGTGMTKGYVLQGDTTFSADTVYYGSLPGGSYDFTVIDSLGCEVYPTAIINSPDSLAADSVLVLPVTCSGDTDGEIRVYGSGGTIPYTYILMPGADTSSTGIYTNLAPGDYTVQIGDSHGCKPFNTPLLTLLEPPTLVFDSSATTTISCGGLDDGMIAIYASGGLPPYDYSVDDGATFGPDSLVTGLGPGTYRIIVRGSSGCTVAGDTITLSDPPGLSLNSSAITDVSNCAGDSTGAITVSASGGTGALEYSLDSLNWQASGTFTDLPAGIYSALVRDSRSCLISFPPDTIIEPPVISATITTTTAMIPDPGSINISATGGTPPLEFSIDSGATFTADTFYLVPSDIYGVVIRDANGCTHEESVTVTATPPLEVNVSSMSIDCYNNNNGSIALSHLNGIGYVSYSIDGGSSFYPTGDFTGLAGGMYYIQVRDDQRIFRDTVEIIDPPPFDVTGTITPATCSRNSFDGAVSLAVSGATPPYSYLWSNDSTGKDISGLEERTYQITITDQNGCQFTDAYLVSALVSLLADAGRDTVVCYGTEVTLNGSGGDEFTWSPEEGLSRADIPDPVTTVTDSVAYVLFTRDVTSGCSDRDTVILTVHPDRGISAGQDTTIAAGQSIVLTATGGPFDSYLWQPSDGLDNPALQSPTASVTAEITYRVTGTTEFGCEESDSMNIFLAAGLKIYSGFTPNGDGHNDFWDIDDIIYYPNASVKVFDRWGRVVFSSVGYADNQRWDGKYKGKELPIGTYYYIIELKDGSEPYKGPVTIVR
jgi:gliding motility-associated-like protein